ncbi:MAG TPA: TMEM14 family protein [Planctomycetota bacterium]|nr:TMEM14 family protein [Planctomycetota bacterium]
MPAGQITLLVFAALVALGGIMGYARARSRPSLIAGVGSAALLVGCYFYSRTDLAMGYWAGAIVSALLCVVFAMRLRKTRKFMPSGMLLVLSIVATALLVFYARGVD